jgi:putative transposase
VQDAYRLSERKAAGLIGLPRGTMRYQIQRDPQSALRLRLRELAATRVRYGYRRLTVLLKREGFKVNAKRIYRLYKEEGLTVRTKSRKKLASRSRVPLSIAVRPNQRWSMDFIHERTDDGRSFRVLSIIDQFTRECVALVADRAMTGAKVVAALDQALQQGVPNQSRLPRITEVSSSGKPLMLGLYSVV